MNCPPFRGSTSPCPPIARRCPWSHVWPPGVRCAGASSLTCADCPGPPARTSRFSDYRSTPRTLRPSWPGMRRKPLPPTSYSIHFPPLSGRPLKRTCKRTSGTRLSPLRSLSTRPAEYWPPTRAHPLFQTCATLFLDPHARTGREGLDRCFRSRGPSDPETVENFFLPQGNPHPTRVLCRKPLAE